MESIIESIIERRRKLGWSNKLLAAKSNVPYSAIVRMEKGIGYWKDYFLKINSILNKAMLSLPIIEKKQAIDINNITPPINEKDLIKTVTF